MRTGLNLTGAALLAALTVRAAPVPATASDQDAASAPRVNAATIETRPLTGTLAREASSLGSRNDGPVWVGYSVPQVQGHHQMCCWESIKGLESSGGCCGKCSLERGRGLSIFNNDDDKKVRLEPDGHLNVLFRTGKGGVTRIAVFSQDCQLDTGSRPFIWLTGVTPDQSLDWLESVVEARTRSKTRGNDDEDGDDEDLRQSAVMAIAVHAGTRPDRLLERLAASGNPHEIREQAIFWMGQTRGRAGYDFLSRMVKEDPSIEIRKKAIFSLSQSEIPEGVDLLIRLAHDDPRSEVRQEALFWLAQKAGQRAVGALTDALENDPEIEVKKKAVFALSQLPPEEGIPLLLDVAKKHRIAEIRKEAIFWLGQSGDPRALDLIEEILR